MAFLGLENPQDVYAAVTENERFWGNRNRRMNAFRNLVRQIDVTQARKSRKYHQFEGNESGTFYSVMVQLLSRNEPQHRIPLSVDTAESRATKGQIERLIHGTYRDVDYHRSLRMDGEPLQNTLSKFICADGWGVAEVVKQDNANLPPLDIRTYDSMEVYPQWGPHGLVCVIMHTERTKLDVQLEYPSLAMEQRWRTYNNGKGKFSSWQLSDHNVDVYTLYYAKDGIAYKGEDGEWRRDTEVFYGVAANGDWAIKPRKLSWAKRIPVVVMPVNGLPFRSNKKHFGVTDWGQEQPSHEIESYIGYRDDWTVDVGRGIFYMNENLYSAFNELWARIMDFIAKEAGNTYWKKTKDGDDNELEIGRGYDAINPLAEDEEIGRLAPGSLGQEIVLALQQMSGMLQRGGISWQLTGQIPPGELSGFAINQLISAALTVATPYLHGLVAIYRQLDQLILDVYRSSGRSSQLVSVIRDNSYIEEEINLAVLEERTYYFDVKLKPGLPDDLSAKVNIANLAKEGMLLDDWTILDEVIGVDDPELIIQRKDEQEIMNLPTVRLRRMAAMMIQRGDIASAAAIIQELMLLKSGKDLQQGMVDAQLMQLQGLVGQQGMADRSMETGQGGAGPDGQPPGPAPAANPMLAASRTEGGGLPPEVLPPEQRGVSPAAARGFADALLGGFGRGV